MLLIKLTHVKNRLNNKHRSKDRYRQGMQEIKLYILLIEMKNGVVTMENMEISQKINNRISNKLSNHILRVFSQKN